MSRFSLPPRGGKKGENGKVMVIGGSPQIHGAPILAALGALAAGADLVRLFLPETHVQIARGADLNLLVTGFRSSRFGILDAQETAGIAMDWADAVVIGCGFLEDESEAVAEFLRLYTGTAVMDAGALFPVILPVIQGRENILLTPHAGEFERLFSVSAGADEVRAAARNHGVTILRKGVIDVIASPEEFAENKTGTPLMTVGGTGDALAGICSGFIARGLSPFEAGCLAAEHWGETGEELAEKYSVLSAQSMLQHFTQR